MPRLSHFLHPARSARRLTQIFGLFLYRTFRARPIKDIRRGRRERCWCGGSLSEFEWHRSYGVCVECGTYVNRIPPLQEELSRVYSFDYYWHVRQKSKGNPSIEHRPENDRSDGRVQFWLDLIDRYGAPKGRAIEIGCGSGVLLSELKKRGRECIGVDVDEKSAAWIRERMSLDVRSGIFPDIELPNCDLFLALDVLEHSTQPMEFMKRASELLNSGGIAVIQAPIDRYSFRKPFEARFNDAFDDLEHLFIFTDKAMKALAACTGLEIVSLNDTLWLMGEMAVFRKP